MTPESEKRGDKQRQRRAWFVLAILFALFAALAWLVLQQRLDSGRGMPDFSVYSEGRNGLATAAWLLRQLGWQPVALTRAIQQTRDRGLLIIVEPQQQYGMLGLPYYLSESEARGLLNWVAEGNTLLLCSRHQTRLHTELGASVVGKIDKRPALQQATPSFGGFTQQIEQMEVEGQLSLVSRGGVPLWWVGDKVGALLFAKGKGRVLLVADPSVLTHRGLVRRDNVMFLCNAARLGSHDDRVFFDEYHHGLRAASGYWSYLRYHGQHWIVLQMLLVFGVVVWGLALRLGPAKATRQISHADGVDYASAVARIYQQAGVRHRLARWLIVDFLNKLTKHLRLRRTATTAQMLAAWKKKTRADGGDALDPLLQGVSRLRQQADTDQQIPAKELLHWAREFDAFAKTHAIG